ncbi:hypothetical protein SAMN04487869_101416 [Marinobacter sp. DSM 26671]|jgi:hypothetical protein|uniref:hypothetical protein n=1 Tax=Marinobacter sp. DSM 26671 TaxID=1761793 RepID=UPI0008EDE766|nr:hypothetical protein [Marinobacter sp. DSM 26671]SFD96592.1 hypothetical protein SAMN04487869_101416 [Marinobacter sp. DSM 26671]
MIELKNSQLVFRFPQVHARAVGRIDFIKTLRVPDDGRNYPLPAGFGRFHVEHLEDHAERVPAYWLKRGGAILPMYQSEALWIKLSGGYPMAVKIATGKINAVTGEAWTNTLNDNPQDYIVLSEQPWLDGYAVERGTVRQFVASQLGKGDTVEEQVTGKAEFGGIQIMAFPMKAHIYKEHFERPAEIRENYLDIPAFCRSASGRIDSMGIAPGGRISQEIYDDDYGLDAWDLSAGVRCFIHTVNSESWRKLTGQIMPDKPITAREYNEAGVPWFGYYAVDKTALPGSRLLKSLKGLRQKPSTSEITQIGESLSLAPRVDLSKHGRVTDGTF